MFTAVKILFILCLLLLCAAKDDDISGLLCTTQFCKEYIKKNPCPSLPTDCKIQNSTNNGIVLPFPGECNCCKYCIENLALDKDCVRGSPDGALPSVICGDGLFCDKKTSKCVRNPSPCSRKLQDYEDRKKNGEIGHLELPPKCDKRGDYMPVKCIPGESCFCVDKKGDRIFGTFPYNVQADDLTKCACSRNVAEINQVLGTETFSSKRAKCLIDGNFNAIQCVSENCICVHSSDGSPVNPKQIPVNINLISKLPCFDPILHNNGSYLNNCERQYEAKTKQIERVEADGFDGVIGIEFPFCRIDGKYASVQETKTQKYCADPMGNKMEEFVVAKNDPLSLNMNCNCALVQTVIAHFEKPKCCSNGNYRCIQCRRGKCRCVDKNGIQTKTEVDYVDKDKLKCEDCDANNCAE